MDVCVKCGGDAPEPIGGLCGICCLLQQAVERTERGWAGHFCGGNSCKFRRNTLLECGDKHIVVSTVGAYFGPEATTAEKIGHERYYETMVFHAKKVGGYWESDVERELDFESKWAIGYVDQMADEEANEMHETVVNEMTKRLQEGEIDG